MGNPFRFNLALSSILLATENIWAHFHPCQEKTPAYDERRLFACAQIQKSQVPGFSRQASARTGLSHDLLQVMANNCDENVNMRAPLAAVFRLFPGGFLINPGGR